MRRVNYITCCLLLVIIATLAFWAAVMRTRVAVLCGDQHWRGYYTGLCLTEDTSILGYNFYKFTIEYPGLPIYEIDYNGKTFAPLKATYSDGTIALLGDCRIEGKGSNIYPLYDEHQNCRFYSREGKLVSQICMGTGNATLYDDEGNLRWTAEYRNGQRVWWKRWEKDGSLAGSGLE